MANERLSGDALNKLSAGQLLDRIHNKLVATNAIETGGPNGLIKSLEDQPGGKRVSGLTKYRAGLHRPSDMEVNATFRNQKPLATETSDKQRPAKLHVVVEEGYRYSGSSGEYSLRALARLTVATSAIAADFTGSKMQAVFVADKMRPVVLNDQEDTLDDLETLRIYDKFVKNVKQNSQIKSSKDSANALINGLNYLDPVEGLDTRSDAILVVSDFLMGASRNKQGKVVDFTWHSPLANLAEEMDDRLYVARLTTPAQSRMPLNAEYSHDGRLISFDTAEYMKMNSRYAGSEQKAEKISEILSGMRVLELDSNVNSALLTVGDFVFGEPQED